RSFGRRRVMMNSYLAAGMSDVLSLPKAIFEMKTLGISREDIRKVSYTNALEFYRIGSLPESASVSHNA
ncbi:MAG: hypothetical protein Q7R39_02230, partial [Dehalococcoidia bacterium]|nr:hypothetical protein [Dehalococcoidia bacterium]